MAISQRIALVLILACAACAVSPAAWAQVMKAADAPGQPRCQTDADCVLDPVDCSECGRCPGETPWTVPRAQIPAIKEDCARHPPVRLNPKAAKLGLTAPACAPCADPGEVQILWRAVCRQGVCAAEQAGTRKRSQPKPTDLVNPPPNPKPKVVNTEKQCPKCLDGFGSNCYYDKTVPGAPGFRVDIHMPPEADELCFAIDSFSYCGSCYHTYQVRKGGELVTVTEEEFERALAEKNKACNNCLQSVQSGPG